MLPMAATTSIENETWGFSGTATKDFEYSGLNHSVRLGLDVGRIEVDAVQLGALPDADNVPVAQQPVGSARCRQPEPWR